MNENEPLRLFKKLTAANWREHDGAGDHIARISGGRAHEIADDDWAALFLETKLSESVPQEVRHQFEVAQGAMCYGCYFYPLYTLGSEQLYRVLEAALHYRCGQLGAPEKLDTFKAMLDWLRSQDAISESKYTRWDGGRRLRNNSSHARRQSIYSPDMAVGNVRIAAELINDMYA